MKKYLVELHKSIEDWSKVLFLCEARDPWSALRKAEREHPRSVVATVYECREAI